MALPGAMLWPQMTFSRRNFLAGTAAAAAVPPLLRPGAEAARTARILGPGPSALELLVNGQKRALEAEPRTTLLEALRWKLGLTGAKDVCDRGSCGACTVLVDGAPRLACMTLAVEMAGRAITTVEGLGTPDAPGAVQSAFIAHDAVQCGYCIPGLVVSAQAALNQGGELGPVQWRQALAGNVCRCGTYNKVIEAGLRAGGKAPAAGRPENAPACLESARARVDAPEKICGTAAYGADIRREGMLFAMHVLCPFGQAKLLAADVETVRRLPGVVDLEIDVGQDFRYSGAPAGWVCAESPAALRDALQALNLQWEPSPVETDPYKLHEQQHGAFPPAEEQRKSWRNADQAEEALRGAAVVLERTYATQVQTHTPLEPHGAMVDPTTTPAEGWFSTQGTFTCVETLTRGLKRDAKDVVVRCDYVGGGFGSKFGGGREGLKAAELAAKHGRPVRVFNSREVEQLDAGNRPGSLQWMKFGADKDGRILGGFWYVAGTVGVGGGGGASVAARYELGAVARTQVDLRGHHGAPRAFRAPGRPQGQYALESMLDELADALKIDPLDLRRKNETSEVRRRMYDVGAKEIGWERRQAAGAQKGRLRRGFGVACGDWGNDQGSCGIRLTALPDGRVHLFSGTQDIGTGQRSVLADVAADALGLDRSHIVVHLADSRYPEGPASGGSTTARFSAPAVRDAAARLLAALPGQDGRKPENPAAWDALLRRLPADGISVEGSFNDKYWGQGGSDAVQFVEVQVDAETGVVRVQKVVALQACGLVANRLTAENQVIGGVIQGISYALFEERATDPQLGNMLNADLEHYKIAGTADIPDIVPILWPQENGGVRSLGEPTTIPTAGAVANAVSNALGARVRALPITPDKVLAALEERA
ncbi:MAG: 2Fe-2S iron-sulfur cluster binding domain-containing protein [Planctomycetota bacterium]|nr:MAG: 2Fe-2S iron-sulfur cluster binding domain-containing protein [Planctomycetota bacterium]